MWAQPALGPLPLGALRLLCCVECSLTLALPGTCMLEEVGDTRAHWCFWSHVPLEALIGLGTPLGSLPPSTQITWGRWGRHSLYCREGTWLLFVG